MDGTKLDARLEAIARYIRYNSIVADVGCDHGYLAAYLAHNEIATHVYAADINEMPLQRAEHTVNCYGLSKSVTTVLSNGLFNIPHEVNDIVIAGMGGELISDIIEQSSWVKVVGKRLILQPMTFAEKLRRYLYSHGYEIVSETPVVDSRHIYCILCAEYTGNQIEISEFKSVVGKMVTVNTEASRRYIQKQYDKYHSILKGIEKSNQFDEILRYQKLVERLEGVL